MKDSNSQWDYNNENLWSAVASIFSGVIGDFHLFSTLPAKDLNDNLKLDISFYIEYIKKAPNAAFQSKDEYKANVFQFLGDTCDVVGKTAMMEIPGLMVTIGGILDPSMYDDIEDGTKNAANVLLKKLL